MKLTKTSFDGRAVVRCRTNGSSELLSGIAMSLVGIVYNMQLMKYAGEDGVAAYGVLMYVSMIFASALLGYSSGVAPVFGYHYGACDFGELKALLKKSLIIIGTFSVCMFVLSEGLARPISAVFVGYDRQLMELTVTGFVIYSLAYLFMGMAIFSSSFFTALNNGLVSAAISFLRTLVFELGAVLLLPLIWEINGVWASIVVAEFMATIVGAALLIGLKRKYNY